jgi:S1/P1 Nuclease
MAFKIISIELTSKKLYTMKRQVKNILLIGFLFFIPFSAMAWGLLGHRVVGQIADAYLSKRAKKEIVAILGNESVAMSSNWADFIKSDPTYGYLGPWHYVNFKAGLTENEVKTYLASDTATDAYVKINWLTAQLKNRSLLSQENKVFYLRLLIHIVGDIHQPLHVGRPDDRGGNSIKVLWFNNPHNLHQVWDEKLIEMQDLSYTEYSNSINFSTKEQRNAWQAEPLADWFWQSYQIAEKIYADVKQPEEKLGYGYNFKYIGIANQQLLKGGVHLAGLLNEIFK